MFTATRGLGLDKTTSPTDNGLISSCSDSIHTVQRSTVFNSLTTDNGPIKSVQVVTDYDKNYLTLHSVLLIIS
jgi:hypothetical protein